MVASPIIKYLAKNEKINIRDQRYVEAFNKLKLIMTSPPLLIFPDFTKKFVLTTDASDLAVGAVLSQNSKPICFASPTLNGYEKQYHTLEKELLAIIWAVRYFRPYLYGRSFIVQTDHHPLKWLYSLKEPNSRIFRCKVLLSEFDFEVEYIRGKENKVADYLSRMKYGNQGDEIGDFDIKSLFENSIDTLHSASEDSNNHFQISEFIVNKYLTQIRIVNRKHKESEKIFNKYQIVYVEEADLTRSSYLTDLFRKFIKKGTIGVHSELPDYQFNIIQEKLINLFANNKNIKFTKCSKIVADIRTKEEILGIIERTHHDGNHRGIAENYEELKWRYFHPNLKNLINQFINRCHICNENKYARKPIKKCFNYTETPNRPNEIVHVDIFHVFKMFFLTTIDKFTKLASVHK